MGIIREYIIGHNDGGSRNKWEICNHTVTHNFISKAVVSVVSCLLQKQIRVKVASGIHMFAGGTVKDLKVAIQEWEFLIDFYVLDLNDFDAVLGTQWFKTLGLLAAANEFL